MLTSVRLYRFEISVYKIRELTEKEKFNVNDCVFCESAEDLRMFSPDVAFKYQVGCIGCHSRGPCLRTRGSAIEKWNWLNG